MDEVSDKSPDPPRESLCALANLARRLRYISDEARAIAIRANDATDELNMIIADLAEINLQIANNDQDDG